MIKLTEHYFDCSACGGQDMVLVGPDARPRANPLCTLCEFEQLRKATPNIFERRAEVAGPADV